MVKPGFYIKVLNDIKAPNRREILLPQYSVVTVLSVDDSNNTMQVKDVLDEVYVIPANTKYQVLGRNKKAFRASTDSTFIKSANGILLDNRAQRSIMYSQVIASQAIALGEEDPALLSKLSIAASLNAMSLSPILNYAQAARLQSLAKKLTT